jgi:transcriptional regulator with XRE-family HTH domain
VLPISQRLQSVMEAKGWTPDELAHKSRLHPDTVRRVLNGNIYSLHALARVSNALGAADPYELPLVHPVIPPAGDGVPHPFGYPDYAMLAQMNNVSTEEAGRAAEDLLKKRAAREAAAQMDAWIADQRAKCAEPATTAHERVTDQGTDLTPELDKRLAQLKGQGTTSQQRENWAVQQMIAVDTHAEVAEAIDFAVKALRKEINGLVKTIGTDVGQLKGLVHLCQSADIEHSDDIEALKFRMGMMYS